MISDPVYRALMGLIARLEARVAWLETSLAVERNRHLEEASAQGLGPEVAQSRDPDKLLREMIGPDDGADTPHGGV